MGIPCKPAKGTGLSHGMLRESPVLRKTSHDGLESVRAHTNLAAILQSPSSEPVIDSQSVSIQAIVAQDASVGNWTQERVCHHRKLAA